ncbi:MAG: T9SS type A sorting domain-containing protein, partial [Candidatus Krumholzibacteriota bacterium]|nr:T9SS type A sorting domain-containing protein [Candidatus Krumholzibacteriota bacterium]
DGERWQTYTARDGLPEDFSSTSLWQTFDGAIWAAGRRGRLCRFDGERWHQMGSGVGTFFMGLVHTIAQGNNVLYVGGMFDQVGIWETNNIARYDLGSEEWHPLGQGTDRAVRTIRVADNGDVYVVGEFTRADGMPARAVARFDGNIWHSLGEGLQMITTDKQGNPVIRAGRAMGLAIAPNGVYVGGMFTLADGVECSNIAYWDGVTFQPLAAGVNGLVTALTFYDGQLYVGGQFTTAGGSLRPTIARWDRRTGSWYRMGGGLGGSGYIYVRSIVGDGDVIYVGGEFQIAGAVTANNIAAWDGATWSAFGSGTNDEVKVITKYNDALYVGGNFTSAGDKPIAYMTRWVKGVIEFDALTAVALDDGVALSWSVSMWTTVIAFRVYRSSGFGEEIVLLDELSDINARSYFDPSARPGGSYTYRIGAVREDGSESYSSTATASVAVPALSLSQNHPNPFNPSTIIEYALPQTAPVLLTIHDVRGRLVRRLVNETIAVGNRSVEWDGRDERGNSVSTGVYFYRLVASGEVLTRKMVLVK